MNTETNNNKEEHNVWFNNGISVTVTPTKPTTKTEAPVFNHPEIESLYLNDIRISEIEINTLLNLPKKTLIQDLELVLQDSIDRFTYFNTKSTEDYEDVEYSFVMHSLFLLAELEAKESLPIIFKVLCQGEDYIELFIGDFSTEGIWEVIFKLTKDDLSLLTDLMLESGVYIFSKNAVSDAVSQVAFHFPKREEEVLKWFESILTQYLEIESEANIIDAEGVALMVSDIVDLKGVELLPVIKKLFNKGYVFRGVCGSYEDIEKDINDVSQLKSRKEVMSINDRYKHILKTWAGYQEEDVSIYNDTHFDYPQSEPIVKDKKIGRNEPCPCGSGKKYKKCCL